MITPDTLEFLTAGSLLGLSAGISPGPLLTLVMTQTLKYNRREGIKVALSPLVTDLPIIGMTLVVISKISQSDTILGMISLAGAIFVAFLGYESITSKGFSAGQPDIVSKSLRKGIIANFLSPHPYLFWATVGAPYVLKAHVQGLLYAILFLGSFYFFLVGSKISVALLVARSKKFMREKTYRIIMWILGIALFVFSLMLLYEGYQYLAGGSS